MKWSGKVFGGIFGYLIAGPIGSVFGFFLGHQFDKGPYRLNINSFNILFFIGSFFN